MYFNRIEQQLKKYQLQWVKYKIITSSKGYYNKNTKNTMKNRKKMKNETTEKIKIEYIV